MCLNPASNRPQNPFTQSYQSQRSSGIDKSELRQLAEQATADGELDAGEVQVFKDIVRSQGPISAADLMGLPSKVQALFNRLNQVSREVATAAQAGGDDDYVRENIGQDHLNFATPSQKAGMIVNLLDGHTGDDDEQAILRILNSPDVNQTLAEIKKQGHLDWLFDDINGSEYQQLLEIDAAEIREKMGIPPRPRPTLTPPDILPAAVQPAIPPAVTAPVAPTPVAAQAQSAPAPVATPPIADTSPRSLDDPNLSPARQAMRHELEKVIHTSRWGYQPNKSEVAAGKRNLFAGTKQMANGTTCGLLPGSMLNHLGVRQSQLSGSATNGIEIQGRRLGVWVDSDGNNRPKPGDVYALRYAESPNARDSVAHVGVIYDTSQDQVWWTADSGQGSKDAQSAGRIPRQLVYDEQGFPMLSKPLKLDAEGQPILGEFARTDGEDDNLRRIAGWVDLDKVMFLQSYQDLLLGTEASLVLKKADTNQRGIDIKDLTQLAEMALRDGGLNATEISVFNEIAHNPGTLAAEDIASLPQEVQAIFTAAVDQPKPPLIALPGDLPDNPDKPKNWTRRRSPIELTGVAAKHS
ncbi:MAG: hypothetical protein CVV27_05040 [Candidatus Melainabacteria bacterium HGW-Melainabacteria-1]|nr:MAG: hypothetical protein CVV27_05040 [Candidatus Melainabacteria bacterium HGW-Melainabacteria-1]